MEQILSARETRILLERLKESASREECAACDCFQGFLAQLELDAAGDITELTDPLKCPRERMHRCLGCDPCPAGALFTEYLWRKMVRFEKR